MLTHLRDVTGESAQLYRRQGDMRICVAAAERLSACGHGAGGFHADDEGRFPRRRS
ncbi:hypothetical protein GCM10023238_18490 [Streptomyces heliomycini]